MKKLLIAILCCCSFCMGMDNNQSKLYQKSVSGSSNHSDISELLYASSEPVQKNPFKRFFGETCEVRIMESPAELLQYEDYGEYERLKSIFFRANRESVEEITFFLNQCTFSALGNECYFKDEVYKILCQMVYESDAHRDQVFSLIAFSKYKAKVEKRDILFHFSESNDGSLYDHTKPIPEINIDLREAPNCMFNVLGSKGRAAAPASSIDGLYHEIGHILYVYLLEKIYAEENSFLYQVASLGRSICINQCNLEKDLSDILNRLVQKYGEKEIESVLSEGGLSRDNMVEIMKYCFRSSQTYNEFIFTIFTEVAQILGFFTFRNGARRIIFLNPNSDFYRSLATKKPIRIDHKGNLENSSKLTIDKIIDELLKPFQQNENIDSSFYLNLALAFGFPVEDFYACIKK